MSNTPNSSTRPVIPNKRTVFESIRTLIGNENQVRRELGLPFIVRPNSTLNQLLSINPQLIPPSNVIPTINYFCIGMGGVSQQNCNEGVRTSILPKVYQHHSDNTGLFKMIPFVMREINNDLSPVERAMYALRRTEEHKGTNYFVYYLKRLDLSQVNVETNLITKEVIGQGQLQTTTTEYEPTESNLKPTARDLSTTEENVLRATYGRTVAQVPVRLDANDVNELYNVFNIIAGDPMAAVVTEIGLVSGVDKIMEITTSGGRAQFNEVIAAQVSHINRTLLYLAANSGGFTSLFNCGINEPIFNISRDAGTPNNG